MKLILCIFCLIVKCGCAEVIFLNNLKINANGAPNLGQSKNEDHTDNKVDPDFLYTGDDVTFKLGTKDADRLKANEFDHNSKSGNDIEITPKDSKYVDTIFNDGANNFKIFILKPDDLNEIEEDKLNIYKGSAEAKTGDAEEIQKEIEEIKAGAFLLGILSSLRKDYAANKLSETPTELGFNIYVPISDDIVNPPFVPRAGFEKVVDKNGLPLIDLKRSGMRIRN